MATGGFIKINRKILDWQWYGDIITKSVFLHLILTAAHKDTKYRYIELKRGDVVITYPELSESLGISIQQARTAVSRLKATGEITGKIYSKFQVITVQNYDMYQDVPTDKKTGNQQATNRQDNSHLTGKQTLYNKNIEEIKKSEEYAHAHTREGLDFLFECFWKAYPRKVNKVEAKEAFISIEPDEELTEKIISAVKVQAKSEEWTEKGGKFIPYPAKYLSKRYWENVIEVQVPDTGRYESTHDIAELEAIDDCGDYVELDEEYLLELFGEEELVKMRSG